MTYSSDRHAFSAHTIECSNGVEIAYTWHQPTPNNVRMDTDDSETAPILQLNDDCLFTIFDYCDRDTLVNLSETCKRFANLLENHYHFPNIDKRFLLIKWHEDKSMSIPLADTRKILRLMGRYFNELGLYVDETEIREQDKWDKLVFAYLQQIGKYCSNIQQAVLSFQFFKADFIAPLVPVFNNLRKLNMDMVTDHNIHPNDNLIESLPKLKTLWLPPEDIDFCKMNIWPSLETVYIDWKLKDHNVVFFMLNQHLRCLKLSYSGVNNLEAAADYLPNIERLTLQNLDKAFFPIEYFLHVKRFENLRKLTIKGADSIRGANLEIIVDCLINLKNLEELKLYFNSKLTIFTPNQYQETVLLMAKTNPKLERFVLSNVELTEKTVVSFVEHAKRLKVLSLENCDVIVTESLIKYIVSILKACDRKHDKLELVVEKNNGHELSVLYYCQQFLKIKWHCKQIIPISF